MKATWRRWRRQRGMTVEQKLIDHFEEFGVRGFRVLPSAEAFRITPRRARPSSGTPDGGGS